jgi:hypothetical protein
MPMKICATNSQFAVSVNIMVKCEIILNQLKIARLPGADAIHLCDFAEWVAEDEKTGVMDQ